MPVTGKTSTDRSRDEDAGSFAERAKRVKLVATDIDGVWTDARMYYSADGDTLKAFSTYDGMAVQRLREAGIPVAILTSEDTEIVKRRAEKLKIEHLFLGESDKLGKLRGLCSELRIGLDEVAYIGDDLNDLAVLEAAGLTAMPSNSPILDRFVPDRVTERAGGDGAFREFADLILKHK